ncbi:MAG: metallophosphoesterase [Oscillospiraceae bacterium]|nr:metallophosphoesterase [Oscillospiraceae bacterium]
MKYIITAIILLAVYLVFEALRSANCLRITRCTAALKGLPKELKGLKIVTLSDLHEKSFGKHNRRLAEKIAAENPDFIACPGDMHDSNRRSYRSFMELLDSLEGRFPVYYSPGNHDLRNGDGRSISEAFKRELQKRGVVCLLNSSEKFKKNGAELPIYGYIQDLDEKSASNIFHRRLLDITGEDILLALNEKPQNPALLLAHDPHQFEAYVQWGAALTLSGHVHGGIVRIPFFGGVFSPHFLFFPRYDAGMFENKGCKMLISSGLGPAKIMRLWNRAEIIVLTLE